MHTICISVNPPNNWIAESSARLPWVYCSGASAQTTRLNTINPVGASPGAGRGRGRNFGILPTRNTGTRQCKCINQDVTPGFDGFLSNARNKTPMHSLNEEGKSSAQFNAPPVVLERAQAMLARMAAIKNAPLSPDEEPPELSERQQKCIETFAVREEVKNLRG